MKAEEAERMNRTTEAEKAYMCAFLISYHCIIFRARDKSIRDQIEDAAKPKPSIIDLSKPAKKMPKTTSPDIVDPGAIYPSVIPEKVFFSTVC